MKYEAIKRCSSEHSMRRMCRALGLRESAYYKWLNRAAMRLKKMREHMELVKKVRKSFDDHKQVYQKALDQFNITGSMSRPACPYDNACAESFFSTAKRECIYKKEYANLSVNCTCKTNL